MTAGGDAATGSGDPRTAGSGPAIAGLDSICDEVIYDHVFENADREVGGVLVGRLPKRGGAPEVTGAIEAFWADEREATLTFTQEAWEEVHNVLAADFPPGTQIIGWYHSHPGYGIFLSEHDLFIHRNFFDSPSQVALVVDPVSKCEGVFAWRRGDVRKLYERATPPDWTASAVPQEAIGERPVVAAEPAAESRPMPDPTARHSRAGRASPPLSEWTIFVAAFLLLVLLGALIGMALGRVAVVSVLDSTMGSLL